MLPDNTAPRVYKFTWYTALIYGLECAAVAGGGIALLIAFRHDAPLFGILCACVLVPLGLWGMQGVLFSRLIFSQDRIEIKSLVRHRSIERTDVCGRRTIKNNNYPPSYILASGSDPQKQLKFMQFYKLDDSFEDWFNSLRDLDTEDIKKSTNELKNDPLLGDSEDERHQKIEAATRYSKVLLWTSVGLFAWIIAIPFPYKILVWAAASIPLVGVCLAFRYVGAFKLAEVRNDAHASLLPSAGLSCAALAIGTLVNVNLLNWTKAWELGLLPAAFLIFLWSKVDAQAFQKKGVLIAMLVLAWCFGMGVVANANIQLDHSAGQPWQCVITGMQVSRSSKTTTYELDLSPWPDEKTNYGQQVPKSFYDSVQVGQQVCANFYFGALKIPYYQIELCPVTGP